MRFKLLTAAVLFVLGASLVLAEDQPGSPGGPPPGKGKNKSVQPAPLETTGSKPVAELEKQIADLQKKLAAMKSTPTQPNVKQATPTAKPEGIGQQVSAWARSGIHGAELAARIHQLQLAKGMKGPPTAPAPSAKPEKKKGYETPSQPSPGAKPPGKGKGKDGSEE